MQGKNNKRQVCVFDSRWRPDGYLILLSYRYVMNTVTLYAFQHPWCHEVSH